MVDLDPELKKINFAGDSSSTSIIYEPDYVVLNPTTDNPIDDRPSRTEDITLRLDPMETVRLRRIEPRPLLQQEIAPASLIRIEADLATSMASNVKFQRFSCLFAFCCICLFLFLILYYIILLLLLYYLCFLIL